MCFTILLPSVILSSTGKCVFLLFSQRFSSFTVPRLPPSFSFDLVQVAEQQVELCWSDFMALIDLNISSFEVFLQYREETNGELFCGERIEGKLAYRTESRSVAKKVVEVPISLSSRGVTVAGLSPGSVYSFTLRAAHPGGSSWTLGQTQTAYTSLSTLYLFKLYIHTYTQRGCQNNQHVCFLFYRTSFSSKYHCRRRNYRSGPSPLDTSSLSF